MLCRIYIDQIKEYYTKFDFVVYMLGSLDYKPEKSTINKGKLIASAILIRISTPRFVVDHQPFQAHIFLNECVICCPIGRHDCLIVLSCKCLVVRLFIYWAVNVDQLKIGAPHLHCNKQNAVDQLLIRAFVQYTIYTSLDLLFH